MNKKRLCELMKARKFSQETLAFDIGIDRSTFNRKLGGYRKGFSLGEVRAIRDTLRMSDQEVLEVFFGQ